MSNNKQKKNNNNNNKKKQNGNGNKRRPAAPPRRRGGGGMSGFTRTSPGMVGAAVATGKAHGMTELTFSNSERIATITTGTAASGVVYTKYINAGNVANFTNSFLSKQAQLFDKYQFSKFEVEYVPVSSTATNGNVIIGMDLSANDAVPTDAIGMTNLSLGYAEGNVWRPFKFAAQCFPCFPAGPKFVRSSSGQLSDTSSLYDMGALHVFVEGAPVSTAIGYIDVHYTVKLQGVNRNPGADPAAGLRPVGAGVIELSNTTISPGGLWAGTEWASFNGFTPPAVGTQVFNAFTSSLENTWGVSPAPILTANSISLPAGSYIIRLVATVASDTYSNGHVKADWTTGSLTCNFGWGAGTLPATAYVNSATVASEPAVVTFTSTTTIALSTVSQYSATFTGGKTWVNVFKDSTGRAKTFLEVTLLSA